MAEITAKLVRELREATNLGMMDCKKALVETDGDMDEAIKILRERGLAIAAKRADRAANQGLIASVINDDCTVAALVEVNSETDFVAKNDSFKAFVDAMAAASAETDGSLAESKAEELTSKIAEIGENLKIRRNDRFVLEGTGRLASYLHLGGKIGVILEAKCEKAETTTSDALDALLKDLCMHIAAANPPYQTREEVPEDVLSAEKDIFRKQVEGKPEEIIDKIIEGKVNKYYSEVCFPEQAFVKDNDKSITEVIEDAAKALDDKITVSRYVRYQLGA